MCSQTVYEIFYKTFLLLASNLNSIWNILQIKMGEQAYLFGTNLYRLIFTCFNFRSVRTVPKNKPSVSCTRFFYSHLSSKSCSWHKHKHNLMRFPTCYGVGRGDGVWPATSPDLPSPPTPWHTQATSLELQQAVTASHCSPCGPAEAPLPPPPLPVHGHHWYTGTTGTKPQVQAQV